MTKRQTTGLPKQTPKPAGSAAKATRGERKSILPASERRQAGGLTREYRSRAEREQQLQRRIVQGTLITAAAIIVILVIAIVLDQIIRPNQVVAAVGSDNVTVGQFERRVKLERVLRIEQLTNVINTYQSLGIDVNQLVQQEPYSTWLSDLRIPDQLGLTVVNELVDEQIVRQEAAARGITASPEEVQTRIQEFFGYDPAALTTTPTATTPPTETPTPFVSPTPSPTPTVTPTPEATAEATATVTPFPTIPPEPTLNATQQADQFNTTRNNFFDVLRRDAGLSEGDINAYFEVQVLREKLRDAVAAEQGIGETGPFVNARHILVDTEEQAQDVLAALHAGESFAALAQAVSKDTGSGANGGELGWSPVTGFVKPFADAVRDAPVGEIIGPVQTEFGYHIIQVRAREDRELTPSQLEDAKNNAFQTWLEDLRQQRETDQQVQIFPVWSSNVPTVPASPFG
ncbi:MAG: peptidylprolyl isomerase [Chloroflexi bacterium]|nr:peptidylprolyl isomerase [Chloroflexota bacterium]